MKKVDNVISNFAKFVKKNVDNKMKNHSTLFNLFMVYKHIMDNDYVIRDEEKFNLVHGFRE